VDVNTAHNTVVVFSAVFYIKSRHFFSSTAIYVLLLIHLVPE